MLNVFETGEASFRLSDRHDADVGWVRDGAMGFGGFATEADATEAALAGSEALRVYLDRLSGTIKPEVGPKGRVRLVRDGAFEWVARGSVPLARLFRPVADGAPPRRQDFAVEFVLPSYVRAGAVIGAAQVVHHAIANRRGTTLVEHGAAKPARPAKAAKAPAQALPTAARSVAAR